jgi:hypothetical protein
MQSITKTTQLMLLVIMAGVSGFDVSQFRDAVNCDDERMSKEH